MGINVNSFSEAIHYQLFTILRFFVDKLLKKKYLRKVFCMKKIITFAANLIEKGE